MKSKSICTFLAIASLWVFTTASAADLAGYTDRTPRRFSNHCPQLCNYWNSQLNLTDTQKKKFNAMNERFNGENNRLRERLYAKNQELRLMWKESEPREVLIHKKQEEINELVRTLNKNTTRHRIRLRNEILTEEQRETLSNMIQHHSRDFKKGGLK